jgi:hypothetical protein
VISPYDCKETTPPFYISIDKDRFAILLAIDFWASIFLYFVYRILRQDLCLCSSNLQLDSFI